MLNIGETEIAGWIGVAISFVSMVGSFVSFVLARKEKAKARESETAAKEAAERAKQFFRNQILSGLQAVLMDKFSNEDVLCDVTAEWVVERFAGCSVEDAEVVLGCLEKQDVLVCTDVNLQKKEYIVNSKSYRLGRQLGEGTFSF